MCSYSHIGYIKSGTICCRCYVKGSFILTENKTAKDKGGFPE